VPLDSLATQPGYARWMLSAPLDSLGVSEFSRHLWILSLLDPDALAGCSWPLDSLGAAELSRHLRISRRLWILSLLYPDAHAGFSRHLWILSEPLDPLGTS
jgi:hypothetical protein